MARWTCIGLMLNLDARHYSFMLIPRSLSQGPRLFDTSEREMQEEQEIRAPVHIAAIYGLSRVSPHC